MRQHPILRRLFPLILCLVLFTIGVKIELKPTSPVSPMLDPQGGHVR